MLFYANFTVFASKPIASVVNETANIELTSDERQVFNLVNAVRREAGLPPYTIDATLVELARRKAEDMVAHGYFAHHSPTYGSPFEMMRNFGIVYTSAGENLAENHTILGAHDALMFSSGHRANILNQRFERIGIGIVDGPCELRTIVQMFIQQ